MSRTKGLEILGQLSCAFLFLLNAGWCCMEEYLVLLPLSGAIVEQNQNYNMRVWGFATWIQPRFNMQELDVPGDSTDDSRCKGE